MVASRRWWLVVGILLALAWWRHAREADGGATAVGDASAKAEESTGGARPAWLGNLSRQVRDASLARLHVVRGELRLEGVVRDADQQAVASARVTLGDGAQVATTEADGTFYFDDLAEGDYAVRAELGAAYAEDTSFHLAADTDPLELELRLGPLVHVLVTDPSGAPIAGAHLDARDRAADTGPDGRATLHAVQMPRVALTASAPGRAPHDDDFDTGDDPTAVFDRTIVLVRGSPVFGTVVDGDGKPVENAMVEVDDDHKDRREVVFSDEHGAWTVDNLATGTYVAVASSRVHVATPSLTFHHSDAQAQRGIVLRVELGAQIAGLVVDARGQPVEGAHVSAGGTVDDTDAQGHYTLTGLTPDGYDVYASTKELASASQHVQISRGEHRQLRLVVQPSGIAGTVVDEHGQPVVDAVVSAQLDSDPNGRGYDKTDELGHFDLGGLPPGEYKVTATHEREADNMLAPPITVATGNRKVRLVLPELATLRGRVVQDGAPVPYFGVALVADVDRLRWETPTPVRSPDGVFKLPGLRAGTRALVIVGPGFARFVVPSVTIASGETRDLGDLVVERGRTLHGHVLDGDQLPIAGATVWLRYRNDSSHDSVLGGLIADSYVAHTDAQGAYEIAGMAPTDRELVIDATSAHAKSHARTIGPDETEVDLIVGRVGILAGTVDKDTAEHHLVVARRDDGADGGLQFYANPDETGAFAFEPLPVGAYTLHLTSPRTIAARHVVVLADQTVTVTYEAPATLVTLRVRWPGCTYLALHAPGEPDGETLGGNSCDGDATTIELVVPGSYELCDGAACETIAVPAQPEVSIVAHPPEPEPEPAPAGEN